jgi:hypothetical protein
MGVWEDSVSRSLTDKNVQKKHRRLLKSRIDCNPVDGDFGVMMRLCRIITPQSPFTGNL